MAVGSGDFGSIVPGQPLAEPTVEEKQERAQDSDRDPRKKTEQKETRRGNEE